MLTYIAKVPWLIVILLCATLGMAPFNPPHLYEKLVMLGNGELSRPIDIFDLCLHAAPFVLLILKVVASVKAKPTDSAVEE